MEVYRQYGPSLLRKCERILWNSADAQDVVHGLFEDLIRRGQTDMSLPYLYRAATNRCLRILRDRRRREALLERERMWLAPAPRTTLDERLLTFETIAQLVLRLSAAEAEVLVYHFLDDLTQEEIAGLVGASRRTVGKRLARVRAAIESMSGSPTRSAS